VSLGSISEAPYNICFLNRPSPHGESKSGVDIYLFVRSKERSDVIPTLKIGFSELMGLFLAQSESEVELLTTKSEGEDGPMRRVIKDVSIDGGEELWTSIKEQLIQAADFGQAEVVKFLISKGADVNAKDNFGITPLLAATYEGHVDVVDILLKKGADKNVKGPDGMTPLEAAPNDRVKSLLK